MAAFDSGFSRAILDGYRKPTPAAWRAYGTAVNAVYRGRCNPHCFTYALSTWAREYGCEDKSGLRNAVDTAEGSGLLFRIDRGEARIGGLCGMVTLRGTGETFQQAYDLAIRSDEYIERQREREVRGLEPPAKVIAGGRIVAARNPIPVAA